MMKSVKIVLGAVAGFFLFAGLVVSAVIYFAVSFYQAHQLFNQAVAAMYRREYEAAISRFHNALGKHLRKSYRAYAFGNLAFCEYSNGRCDEALRDYTEAIHLDPTIAWAHENRGMLHNEYAETDEALKDFTDAIRFDPNSYHAHFSRGLIEMERKDVDAALEDFAEAARIDPSSSGAYNNRGIAYSWKRDYDHALANFDAAIRMNPKYPAALAERGFVYFKKKELEKAIADLTASIQLAPSRPDTYRMRGFALRDQKRWNDAISDFHKALQLNPKDAAALDGRGSTYSLMGEQDRAIADFTALLRDWNFPDIRYQRGLAYSRKGDYDRANLDLREATRLAPDDEWGLNNLAWFLATCPDPKFRNGKEAVTNAMKACTSSRWSEPQQMDTLAAAYAECGQFGDAIAYEIKAMSYDNLDQAKLDDMQMRLTLYQHHKPYRQIIGRYR